jgi:hypothetical protein
MGELSNLSREQKLLVGLELGGMLSEWYYAVPFKLDVIDEVTKDLILSGIEGVKEEDKPEVAELLSDVFARVRYGDSFLSVDSMAEIEAAFGMEIPMFSKNAQRIIRTMAYEWKKRKPKQGEE